jgi:hypothetical protein
VYWRMLRRFLIQSVIETSSSLKGLTMPWAAQL